MTLSVVIALVTVWVGIAASSHSDWPLGFFVGVIGAAFFLAGRAYAAVARSARIAYPATAPTADSVFKADTPYVNRHVRFTPLSRPC